MNAQKMGRVVVVVGASGAGKDSVIRAAKKYFETDDRIEFVRRVITRECDPSTEVHDSVSVEEFKQHELRGDFSVCWQANGLHYGLPAAMHADMVNGKILIANGSRAAIDAIRSSFANTTIVHVTVSEDALQLRLERRKRESADEIQKRLQRNKTIAPLKGDDVITIDNSGERHVAIDEFIKLIGTY